MSAWQRNKGANWERQTVKDAEAYGLIARRFPQCGEKDEEPDVTIQCGSISYDVEVKKGAAPPMAPAFRQAKERCTQGHIPAARVTQDGLGFDVAIIPWTEFLRLISK